VSHLLAADLVRFGRRRDIWLILVLVPVMIALLYLNDFNRTVQGIHEVLNVDLGPNPDPTMVAQVQAQLQTQTMEQMPAFAFPASLVRVATNPLGVILAALYLGIALTAGEFEWGTVRTIHLVAPRWSALAVRVGLISGLVLATMGVGILFAAVAPFFMSIDGTPLQHFAAPEPDLGPAIAVRVLCVLPFIALPILISVVTRSTGLALLLTVLLLVVDVALTETPFWQQSPLPWVPGTTVSGSITRLLSGDDSGVAGVIPAWGSVIALVAWSVLPIVGAIVLFRRLDLTE
jgi:ABC-2 family transporter protein